MTKLTGRSILGFREGAEAAEFFYGVNPANGQRIEPGFSPATPQEVELSAQLASEAFAVYGRMSGKARGAFLRAIAATLDSSVEELIDRANQETALPKPRLQGETARTS